jgi:hypothetical protein
VTHRFRPRYRGLALSAIGIGGALTVVAVSVLGFALPPLVTGFIGIGLGGAYVLSPAWRLVVITDDSGLEVRAGDTPRFRLAWDDVVRVVASPSTQTCFVDGGSPERNLLVPGDGAPAPYDLEDRAELYATILAHVPASKVQEVATLESVMKEPKKKRS